MTHAAVTASLVQPIMTTSHAEHRTRVASRQRARVNADSPCRRSDHVRAALRLLHATFTEAFHRRICRRLSGFAGPCQRPRAPRCTLHPRAGRGATEVVTRWPGLLERETR